MERWNPWSKTRLDLFNFADLLCMQPGYGILAVQTTTQAHLKERQKKVMAERRAVMWAKSGGLVHLHGWKLAKSKANNRKIWMCKIIDLTLLLRGRK